MFQKMTFLCEYKELEQLLSVHTGHSSLEPFVLSVQSPATKGKFEFSRTLALMIFEFCFDLISWDRDKVRENSNFPFDTGLWTLNTKGSRREWPVMNFNIKIGNRWHLSKHFQTGNLISLNGSMKKENRPFWVKLPETGKITSFTSNRKSDQFE